jgi:signal transduction histidine kinase
MSDLSPERFLVEESLGMGGGSLVHRVRDVLDPSSTKILKVEGDDGPAQLRQEFRVLCGLEHPCLASARELGRLASGRAYLLLDDFVGSPVQAGPGQGDLEDIFPVLVSALRTLRFLHAHGIIHHDIKPSHVLVGGPGGSPRVRLIDLGLAGPADPDAARRGTPDYWAPEIGNREGAGPASDLYALGVTLYEWTTGRRPFESESLSTLMRLHREVEPRSLRESRPDVPTWLEDATLRCLRKDPTDRPHGATSLLEMLEQSSGRRVDVETAETALAWLRTSVEPATTRVGESAEDPWRVHVFEGPDEHAVRQAVKVAAASASWSSDTVLEIGCEGPDAPLLDEISARLSPGFGEGSSTPGGEGTVAETARALVEGRTLLTVTAPEGGTRGEEALAGLLRQVALRVADGAPGPTVLVRGASPRLVEGVPAREHLVDTLSSGSIGAFVETALRLPGWTSEDSDCLAASTGGQLAFAEADLLGLIRQGIILPSSDGWRIDGSPAESLAKGGAAVELVADRVRRLPERAVLVVGCLAVFSRPARTDQIEAWFPGESVRDVLTDLAEGGFCVPRDGRWSLTSGAAGMAALEGMDPEGLCSLHARVLTTIDSSAESFRWIEHALLAGREDVDPGDLEKLVARAELDGDLERAAHGLDLQLGVAESTASRRPDLLRIQARVRSKQGRYADALRLLDEANALDPDGEDANHVLLRAQALRRTGSPEQALRALDQPGRGCEGPPIQHAMEQAAILADLRDYAGAERLLRLEWSEADLVAETGNEAVAASVLKTLGTLQARDGRFEEGISLLAEALRAATSCGDTRTAADCQNNLGNIALMQGRADDASKHFMEAREHYSRLAELGPMATVLYNLGRCAKEVGDRERAVQRFEQCRVFSDRTGFAAVSLSAQLALANVHLEGGDWDASRDAYRALLRVRPAPRADVRARALYGLALDQIRRRRWSRARRLSDRAAGVLGGNEQIFRLHLMRGLLSALVSDWDAAMASIEECKLAATTPKRQALVHLVQGAFDCSLDSDDDPAMRALDLGLEHATEAQSTSLRTVAELLRASVLGESVSHELSRSARSQLSREDLDPCAAGLLSLALARLRELNIRDISEDRSSIWAVQFDLHTLCELATAGDGATARRATRRVLSELDAWVASESRPQVRAALSGHPAVARLRDLFGVSAPEHNHVAGADPFRDLRELTGMAPQEGTGETRRWRREEGLRHILEITQALNETLEIEALLKLVADSVISLCQAERAFVIFSEEALESDLSVVVARDRHGDDIPEALGEISRTIVERVLREREPSLHQDALRERGLDDRPSILQLELKSIVCVPLLDRGRCLGVLYADNRSRVGQFDDTDLEVISVFGSQAATAIANSRLFQALEDSYRALEEAQDRLVRTERIRVLGEMAGGVAHDFNNLLTAILARSQLLQAQAREEDMRTELAVIEKAATDGARMVRRIQDFTRVRRDRETVVVDVNEIVQDAVDFTQSRWRGESDACGEISVEMVPAGERALVEGSPSELREVFTNLIINAIEAMAGDGRLVLSVRLAGEEILADVADSGCGIPAEVRERVFDPFFTTKGKSGTGLGLSLVYGIVTRHGGEVELTCPDEGGTVVRVSLPRTSLALGGAEATGTSALRKGLRILVIDDEPDVCEIACRILEGEGVEVCACGSGAEGLRRFEEDGFDLVLTDLGMPGMDGYEVVRRIRGKSPDIPIVIMTGWGVSIEKEELEARAVSGVLLKPFSLEDLLGHVARQTQ